MDIKEIINLCGRTKNAIQLKNDINKDRKQELTLQIPVLENKVLEIQNKTLNADNKEEIVKLVKEEMSINSELNLLKTELNDLQTIKQDNLNEKLKRELSVQVFENAWNNYCKTIEIKKVASELKIKNKFIELLETIESESKNVFDELMANKKEVQNCYIELHQRSYPFKFYMKYYEVLGEKIELNSDDQHYLTIIEGLKNRVKGEM